MEGVASYLEIGVNPVGTPSIVRLLISGSEMTDKYDFSELSGIKLRVYPELSIEFCPKVRFITIETPGSRVREVS